MRDARDSALLLERMVGWLGEIEALARMPDGERALRPLLRYITLVAPDLQLSRIRVIFRGRAPAAESITMTIAEQLRAEGKAEGMAEGKAKGMAEGKAKGMAEALVLILESRGIPVDMEARARLESVAVEDLDGLLRRAANVSSVDELLDTHT